MGSENPSVEREGRLESEAGAGEVGAAARAGCMVGESAECLTHLGGLGGGGNGQRMD